MTAPLPNIFGQPVENITCIRLDGISYTAIENVSSIVDNRAAVVTFEHVEERVIPQVAEDKVYTKHQKVRVKVAVPAHLIIAVECDQP